MAHIYNVLLAEDEAVMRIAFRKMLDWDSTDFRFVASVSNGAEALAYIKSNPVDIVITDLIMPVMDGLDLIQELKSDGFTGVILVLSNYSDFEPVRTALTGGAADYMLKLDIDGEKLLKQLTAAASLIVEQSAPKKQRINSFFPCFIAIYSNKVYSYASSPAQRALVVIEQMFDETNAEIELIDGNEVFMLIPVVERREADMRVMSKLRQTVRQLQVYLDLTAGALISKTPVPAEDARRMHPLLKQSANVFFYRSLSKTMYLEEASLADLPDDFDACSTAVDYISLYYEQGRHSADRHFSDLMERLAAVPVCPLKAKRFFLSVAQKITFAFQTNASVEAEYFADLEEELGSDIFLSQLCARLEEVLESSNLQLFERYSEYRKEVRDALLFVHFHYQDSITLDDVAKAVNLNRDYLCRLFNRETGSPMFRYINSLRMERAASLIVSGNAYMSEVAEAVGINDQFYFARVFKKYYGIPPSEYGRK